MAIDKDGFGLACTHCSYVFPNEISAGVMAAHFEAEHGVTDVRVELVVLCFRCETPMKLERTEPVAAGRLHYYICETCQRTRRVTQEATP